MYTALLGANRTFPCAAQLAGLQATLGCTRDHTDGRLEHEPPAGQRAASGQPAGPQSDRTARSLVHGPLYGQVGRL